MQSMVEGLVILLGVNGLMARMCCWILRVTAASILLHDTQFVTPKTISPGLGFLVGLNCYATSDKQ